MARIKIDPQSSFGSRDYRGKAMVSNKRAWGKQKDREELPATQATVLTSTYWIPDIWFFGG